MNPAKIIAFYLPQFHPIPENDEWWGKDFTEWDNVRSGVPGFPNHYQPHIPASPLGYYDLRQERVQQMQAAMARRFGIHGFCYYYYWFGGKKLLETPLETMLRSGKPDFPFCLCWANPPWTRAWYGQSKQVLIDQDYSDTSMAKLMQDIGQILSDPRYITVNGRPLFCVYQAEELPESKKTTDVWREQAHKLGLAEPYLVRVEALAWDTNPTDLGFDAAIEFAPDWRQLGNLLNPGEQPRRVDYRTVVKNMILKPDPGYKRFRGVFPQWDNTARYKKAAMVVDNASPGVFAYHLETALEYTRQRFEGDEQLIFVNAWNEWGEGCHLEPDERNGTSWLEAIRQTLEQG